MLLAFLIFFGAASSFFPALPVSLARTDSLPCQPLGFKGLSLDTVRCPLQSNTAGKKDLGGLIDDRKIKKTTCLDKLSVGFELFLHFLINDFL